MAFVCCVFWKTPLTHFQLAANIANQALYFCVALSLGACVAFVSRPPQASVLKQFGRQRRPADAAQSGYRGPRLFGCRVRVGGLKFIGKHVKPRRKGRIGYRVIIQRQKNSRTAQTLQPVGPFRGARGSFISVDKAVRETPQRPASAVNVTAVSNSGLVIIWAPFFMLPMLSRTFAIRH